MVRLSKKTRDRSVSFRRPQVSTVKTGPVKDKLSAGYKEHENALAGETKALTFIGQVKRVGSGS